MRISTLFYTLKQGFVNIVRNKWFSLASVATISACLFLFGLFYAIVANFQHIVKTAEEGVSVTVFFDEGISDERIQEIGEMITKRVEVREVEFHSADEVWEEFKEEIKKGGFLLCHWDGTAETEQAIKDETKATIRCIPVDSCVCEEEGVDIYSGKPSKGRVVFAIAY